MLQNNLEAYSGDGSRRLALFLARYFERIGRTSKNPSITIHEAAVLAALHWLDEHPPSLLTQKQMACLLETATSTLSTRMSKLSRAGLCAPLALAEKMRRGIDDNREEYYTLTAKGRKALALYSQQAFGLPSAIGREILNMTEYRAVTVRMDELLDSHLTERFRVAQQPVSERSSY